MSNRRIIVQAPERAPVHPSRRGDPCARSSRRAPRNRRRPRECRHVVEAFRVADAGIGHDVGPPHNAIQYRLEPRPPLVFRFAKHDVVGARFASEHGVVTRGQAAAAHDIFRLQTACAFEGIDAADMRAVGSRPLDKFGMAVEQQRRAVALDQDAQCLDPLDQGALGVRRETDQHGGDVGGVQRGGEIVRDRARIAERRRDEIEAGSLAPRQPLSPCHRMRRHSGGMAAIPAILGRNRFASGCLFPFQIGLPLAERGEAVHARAVDEGALRRSDILGFAGPRGLRGML